MRTVLVTGALGGIGGAIVDSQIAAGNRVVLTDRRDVSSAAGEIRSRWQDELHYFSCDLLLPDAVARLAADIAAAGLAIDILINNAGVKHVADVRDHADEAWHEMFQVNVTAPFQLIRFVAPRMVERSFGRIINVSSVIGVVGSKNRCGYVASKHALVGLTRAVALDLAATGVTCNAVCPGWVDTAFNVAGEFGKTARRIGGDIADAKAFLLKDKQPDLRMIPAREVAELITFLAGDQAAGITGAVLPVDGGWTAQ